MYVSPISTRLVRGRSTPAIRAIVLSLPLLVLLVGADHPYDAFTADDLALDADLFHRRSDFHLFLRSRRRLLSAPGVALQSVPDRHPAGSARPARDRPRPAG